MPEDHIPSTVSNQEDWVDVNEDDTDDRIAQLQELEAELLVAPTEDEGELLLLASIMPCWSRQICRRCQAALQAVSLEQQPMRPSLVHYYLKHLQA